MDNFPSESLRFYEIFVKVNMQFAGNAFLHIHFECWDLFNFQLCQWKSLL